jgi:hypothetical protein
VILTVLLPVAVSRASASDDRIIFQVKQLDNQIAALLLKLPMNAGGAMSPEEMQETYRLVIRHLDRCALRVGNESLRSRIALKADQLAAGLPDFDRQMESLLSKPHSANPAIMRGCRNFYRASLHLNGAITSTSGLKAYLHKILKPLAPLAEMEFTSAVPLVVWPASSFARRQHDSAAAADPPLPPISDEIAALQQANILPEMRDVLRPILLQLQKGLANSATARQSKSYYRVILQCINLAENLQQGTALPQSTRQTFMHRLLLGLLFFKDPRTRAAAARKLESISMVVQSLEDLQTAELPAGVQKIIRLCVHNIILHLQKAHDGGRYVLQLGQIDHLLSQHYYVTSLISHTHPQYTNRAWVSIAKTENLYLHQAATELKKRFSRSAIQRYTRRVGILTMNLNRLIAMPAAAQQALLYHPQPAAGVMRNMRRWARHIAMHPDEAGTAALSFDRFNALLNLLAATHRDMAAQGSSRTLKTISGGRYRQFVRMFLQTQRNLADALAQPQLASKKLTHELNQQRLIFRTSSQLAYLMKKDNPLLRLNQWADWHSSAPAIRTTLNEFEQAMSAQFRTVTAPAINSHPVSSEAWITFQAAAPAINTLASACENLLPRLNAPAGLWSTGWLLAYSAPPGNALYRRKLSTFSLTCMYINNMQFEYAHGNAGAAGASLNAAIKSLAMP